MAHDTEAPLQLEPPDVAVGPVLRAAVASITLMLGAIWGLSVVYDLSVPRQVLPAPERFPSPRVQTGQAEQQRELLAAQRRQLTGYAWADPDKTLVRIPIERAMDIIVQRGTAAYAPLQVAGGAPTVPGAGSEPSTTGQALPRGGGSDGVGAGRRPAGGPQPRGREP